MLLKEMKHKKTKGTIWTRFWAASLCFLMILSLCACSAGGGAPGDGGDDNANQYDAAPGGGASGDGGDDNAGQYDAAPSASAPAGASEEFGGYDPSYDYSGGERYADIDRGERHFTDEEPEATFSLKVDTASYSNVKRYIEDGMLPPENAVRTEELINWFGYDEPLDFDRNSPFAFYTEVGPSPFDDKKRLALIRVGTRAVDKRDLPPSNLVFLIDTSGSMDSFDKLPLLQNAFSMLTETLGKDDRVSIVTYASRSDVVLAGARGSDTDRIHDAIFDLYAGGSTAGGSGIQTAYELAENGFIEGGNNRVILATDGDFNVGISDTGDLSRFIAEKRDTGVYLSALGFGTGNIRDDVLETLAKDGNGNYSYIDSRKTAEKALVDELGSNLFTVADDVKAQIAFDPETVYTYELIGYENRMLEKEDFDDDRKDAGEIGAGSDVIALFEFEPVNPDAPIQGDTHLFDVRLRYKDPGESESKLVEFPVNGSRMFSRNTTDFGFVSAVAVFGHYLRDGGMNSRTVRAMTDLAEENLGEDRSGYREDFVDLLYKLRSLT